MTFGLSGAALAGLAIGGAAIYSANKQEKTAGQASQIQQQSADAGIDEQRRQFDVATQEQRQRFEQLQKLLSPFVTAGAGAIGGLQPYQQAGMQALEQQRALAGLGGPQAQQAAIDAIQGSPLFGAISQQGEGAILANASATGGLRGGNVQAALAQFRPQLLAQMINEQYGRLGGLSTSGLNTTTNLLQLGQAAAAGTGSAGLQTGANIGQGAMTTGANISNLLQQQGAAAAGGALAQGSAAAGLPSALLGGLGVFTGLGGKF